MDQKECPICSGWISLHDEYELKQCLISLDSKTKEYERTLRYYADRGFEKAREVLE